MCILERVQRIECFFCSFTATSDYITISLFMLMLQYVLFDNGLIPIGMFQINILRCFSLNFKCNPSLLKTYGKSCMYNKVHNKYNVVFINVVFLSRIFNKLVGKLAELVIQPFDLLKVLEISTPGGKYLPSCRQKNLSLTILQLREV